MAHVLALFMLRENRYPNYTKHQITFTLGGSEMKRKNGVVLIAAIVAGLALSVPAMAQTKSKTQTRTMTSTPTQSKKGNVNQTGTATSNYGSTTPGPISKGK
jgi:hypothetical protein